MNPITEAGMRVRPLPLALALLLGASLLLAHDLFLKLDSYFVESNSAVRIPVYDGTFSTSESGVNAQRLLDISLVSPTGHARLAAISR